MTLFLGPPKFFVTITFNLNRYRMSPAVSIISIHLPGERIISVPSNVKNREDWLKNHENPSSKLERYFL